MIVIDSSKDLKIWYNDIEGFSVKPNIFPYSKILYRTKTAKAFLVQSGH